MPSRNSIAMNACPPCWYLRYRRSCRCWDDRGPMRPGLRVETVRALAGSQSDILREELQRHKTGEGACPPPYRRHPCLRHQVFPHDAVMGEGLADHICQFFGPSRMLENGRRDVLRSQCERGVSTITSKRKDRVPGGMALATGQARIESSIRWRRNLATCCAKATMRGWG